jgi:adenosylcobinamide kinase / adenosylcobinamide-phosphate guanylyltransferase
MRLRIVKHRQERETLGFETAEEPIAISRVLRELSQFDVVLIDCLTLWLSNLLLAGRGESEIIRQVEELADILQMRARHVIIVTNEVGMGLVPETPLGRVFRDVVGLAHQRLSQCADEVYLAVLGTVLRIKPACSCSDVREGKA